MQRELTQDNLRIAFKDLNTFCKANDMLTNRRYDELEELLKIEWMNAQERAIVLNKMYAELSSKNMRANIYDDEEF